MTNLKGINRKNKHHVQYPDVPSAIKPVPHGPDVPVPEPNVTMESSSDSESSDMIDTAKCNQYRSEEDDQPVPLAQVELNNLTRDLKLLKESAQLLDSRLREKRLLVPGTTFYLKVVGLILGLQGGYTKYPYFLCLWDSCADDQHYVRQEWPSRQGLKPESHNVVSHPLVEPSKILLPPLYIKLGLMKNFVKALDREGGGFAFLHQKFQQKNMEKIKAGIFDGPQIRELIKDTSFNDALNPAELSAWLSLKSVIANFLGNHSSVQYQKVIEKLMENFRQLGARMSVKMHFLQSHLDYFPENSGDFSEE
ncbi:hypothetical protein FHG87_016916 [Trinorchestia longiramus]|nr:hypothetical protein FHG87_016916 [Trinorchestia longiramus]